MDEIKNKIDDLEAKKGDFENFEKKEAENKCLRFLVLKE